MTDHVVSNGLYFTGEAYFEVNPDPGSVVLIGGLALPGKATVDAPEFAAKIDTKEAKGANGAKITFDGSKSAKADIDVVVWTADQYQQLIDILGVLKPPDGKGSPEPWPISHAFFNGMGIDSIVVEKIKGPGFGKQAGTYEAKISVMEWRSAWDTPGSGTPTESKTASATPGVSTVFDQAISASGAVGPPPPPAPTEAGPPPP